MVPLGPTIHRESGLRFYFVMGDLREPPHVHVDSGSGEAKIWLDPVALEWTRGLSRTELAEALRIARRQQAVFLAKWREARERAGYQA